MSQRSRDMVEEVLGEGVWKGSANTDLGLEC